MAWLRLDDRFAQHPKVADLSDRAFRAHVETMLYCSEYATGGRIPRSALRMSKATTRTIEELVAAGVWDRVENGDLVVHDFAIYNGKTIAERVEAFLKRFPGTSANEVHRELGGKREVVLAEVARFQGGSQSGTREPATSGTPEPPKPVPSVGAREPSPSPTPEEPLQEDLALSADRSETTANGLPVENERLTIELLAEIGPAGDEGTPQVVRRYAAQLPEGALAKVLESVRQQRPRDKARYVVGALKDELAGITPKPRSAKLRDEPESWVRQVGYTMPLDVLEEALVELLPEDADERIRLADLASDLRREQVAG